MTAATEAQSGNSRASAKPIIIDNGVAHGIDDAVAVVVERDGARRDSARSRNWCSRGFPSSLPGATASTSRAATGQRRRKNQPKKYSQNPCSTWVKEYQSKMCCEFSELCTTPCHSLTVPQVQIGVRPIANRIAACSAIKPAMISAGAARRQPFDRGGRCGHAAAASGGSRLPRAAGRMRIKSRRSGRQPTPSEITNVPRMSSVRT